MQELIEHLIHIIEMNDDKYEFECGSQNTIIIYDKENDEAFELTAKKIIHPEEKDDTIKNVNFKIHTKNKELIQADVKIPLPDTELTNEVKAILDHWLYQHIQIPIDCYDVIITNPYEGE